MPLYAYRCTHCEHYWEDIRTMSKQDAPEKEACPNCAELGHVGRQLSSGVQPADPVSMGTKKPDSGFRDVLARIGAANKVRDGLRLKPSKMGRYDR